MRFKIKRAFIWLLIAVFFLCGCEAELVRGELAEGSASVEIAEITPEPTTTKEPEPTPAPTMTPIDFDPKQTHIYLTQGSYYFLSAEDKSAITRNGELLSSAAFTVVNEQNFRLEQDENGESCVVYSAVDGLRLGINLKGEDMPREGMVATFMETLSESRSHWLVERMPDGSCVIRTAVEPNLVLTKSIDEEGSPQFIISRYTAAESQHWDFGVFEKSESLSLAETKQLFENIAENKVLSYINKKYNAAEDAFGGLLELRESAKLPTLFVFKDEPALAFSFDTEPDLGSDYTVDDYIAGFTVPAEKAEGTFDTDAPMTGVFYLPLSALADLGAENLSLHSGLVGLRKADGVFAHYYEFDQGDFRISIACTETGLVEPDAYINVRLITSITEGNALI